MRNGAETAEKIIFSPPAVPGVLRRRWGTHLQVGSHTLRDSRGAPLTSPHGGEHHLTWGRTPSTPPLGWALLKSLGIRAVDDAAADDAATTAATDDTDDTDFEVNGQETDQAGFLKALEAIKAQQGGVANPSLDAIIAALGGGDDATAAADAGAADKAAAAAATDSAAADATAAAATDAAAPSAAAPATKAAVASKKNGAKKAGKKVTA
ncbi:hypothetical protein R3P38DRAFT_3608540 [Favolaschia claudopus]|uniref:Uncharacterized protein n=1 Tax=Favolaschia claudopus TaxID=2862362 RepID=A0AAW0DH98_9AGAR